MAAGLNRIAVTTTSDHGATPRFTRLITAEALAPAPDDLEGTARRHLEAWVSGPVTPLRPVAGPRTAFMMSSRPQSDSVSSEDARGREATNEPTGSMGEFGGLLSTLEYRGVETVALTESQVVSYAQSYRGIPVYGAGVGVELAGGLQLVNISGHLANTPGGAAPPLNADPIARLSPAEARGVVKRMAGLESFEPLTHEEAPRLVFRFDDVTERWRLVYVVEGVKIPTPRGLENDSEDADGAHVDAAIGVYRVFIDAHNGERVAQVATRHSLGAVEADGIDADGTVHRFTATERLPGEFILEDPVRRIRTMSLDFNSVDCGSLPLPGRSVIHKGKSFDELHQAAAVVAHANATRVDAYFRSRLLRNGIDNKGMWLISVVDCLRWRNNGFGCTPPNADDAARVFLNAAWIQDPTSGNALLRNGLMVYGQSLWGDGKLHSVAESLDVVAHELVHGVTSYTSDLEYSEQSGALNESYSDILGVAIANADYADITKWNWDVGEEISSKGVPLRSLSHPSSRSSKVRGVTRPYPEHMRDFAGLLTGEKPGGLNDEGFVHFNSSIHNKAAHNLFVLGAFTPDEVVRLFFLTLTTPGRLGKRATFMDSREGMLASCNSLFRTASDLGARLSAVRQAFADVGIGLP